MLYPYGNTNRNYTGKELKEYTFHANFNPIYGNEEAEIITVKIPAPDMKSAWMALISLVCSKTRAKSFRLDDIRDYD